MPDFEKAGYQGQWLPGQRLSGETGITFVLKRRFTVDLASADCVPAEETPPVAMAPELYDEDNPGESDVKVPGELAIAKERVDVMVRGTAFAPGGQPTPEFEVGVRISGVLDQRLRVVGNRVARWTEPEQWVSDKDKAKGIRQEYPPPTFSSPASITKLPLRYTFAYGGKAPIVLDEETAAQAAELQEEAKIVEERNKRKKEIEEELLAEEEAKAEAEAKAAEQGGIADDEARAKAAEAFAEDEGAVKEGGTRVIDAETIARLEAEEAADDGMEVVSALRLGKDLPDRPADEPSEDGAAVDGEAGGHGDGDAGSAGAEDEDEDAPEEIEGELRDFFSPDSGSTKAVDIAALEEQGDGKDELREVLDERERARRQRLRERDGAHLLRTEERGEIQLHDDAWIDEHGARPQEEAPQEAPESEHPEMPYPANPAGRGFCLSALKEAVDGLKLPNIEWPDAPLRPEDVVVELSEDFDLHALPEAAGFGPYPMGWFPRAGYAGVLPWDVDEADAVKRKQLEELDEDDPEDEQAIQLLREMEIPVMRAPFFQEANPRLQVPRLDGDEEVMIHNLTPDGALFLRLPARHPKVTLDVGAGVRPVSMRLDSVLFDLDEPAAPAVEILWRGWYKLKGFEEMESFTAFEVGVDDVDQEDWLELMREQAREERKPRSEGTAAMAAMEDEDAEAILGAEADRRYREDIGRRDFGEVGEAVDESGTVVFRQDLNRRLADDEWDEEIREDKEEWVAEQLARQEAERKAKLKAIRKKAREQADEEFGIERVEVDADGNEIVDK